MANSIDDKILAGFYKQSADKIIQILDKVREEREKNSRRWIWELLQNAKDVKNKYERVSIEIKLGNEIFEFKHNGDPFSETNLISLIQQVSSKHINDDEEDITGFFGTGFISTHLLSELINIKGYIHRDDDTYQSFKLILDRRAENSRVLVNLISEAIEKIRNLDNDIDFKLCPSYQNERKELNYDTVFTYPLDNEKSKNAAKMGLDEFLYTLPTTMVFLHKIKKVTIEIYEKIFSIECQIYLSKEEYEYFKVTINDKIHYFILWKKNPETKLLIEVNNFYEMEIVIPKWDRPVLYKDFPLVGTEKFYLPFYVNGLNFFPTEQRDGIFIKGEDKKQKCNRKILEVIREEAINFTGWLIENNAKNLFVLANTNKPEIITIQTNETSHETKLWFQEFQCKWRTILCNLKLVETENNGLKKIAECKFPRSKYKDTNENNLHFYDLVNTFIGNECLPKRNIYIYWLESLGFKSEIHTWNAPDLIFKEDSLISYISQFEKLDDLELGSNLTASTDIKITFLNEFYMYLVRNNCFDLLNTSPIIPNLNNEFDYLRNLFWENKEKQIPDIILDIIKKLNDDWRKLIIHRKINIETISKREKGLLEASSLINEKLCYEKKNERGHVTNDFLETRDCEFVLINILSLRINNENNYSFKNNLYEYAVTFLKLKKNYLKVSNLDGFSFDKAIRLMIRYINNKIAEFKKLTNLSEYLQKDTDDTITFINKYLCFIESSKEYSYLLEYNNISIVPNREYKFCAFGELYNNGTNDFPLDDELLNILKSLNPNENLYPKLILQGINLKLPRTFEFKSLTESIKKFIKSIENFDFGNFRIPLLTFIRWYYDPKNIVFKNLFFQEYDDILNMITFNLTINNSAYKDDFFILLEKPEKISDLVALNEMIESNNIDVNKIKKLVSSNFIKNITDNNLEKIAKFNSDDIDEVLDFCDKKKIEKDIFRFQLKIGQKIEHLLEETLRSKNINFEIKRRGSGSHDLCIVNLINKKEFFIEVKSYSVDHRNDPIKLSTSQAVLANKFEKNFALCILERPQNPNDQTNEYLIKNIKYLKNLSRPFNDALVQYANVKKIKNNEGDIILSLEDPTCYIKIKQNFIWDNKFSFQELIKDLINIIS